MVVQLKQGSHTNTIKTSYVILVSNADGRESLIKDPCSASIQGKAGVGAFPIRGSPIDWLALLFQGQMR